MTDDAALSADEIRLVRSILKGISVEEWRAIKAIARGIVGAMGSGRTSDAAGEPRVATARELDSQYGDPTVRKDPKRWAGASYAGALYSRCPSDYLIVLAEFLEYKAAKDSAKPDPPKHRNGKFYHEYAMKDAALARGWAERNRGKELTPPTASAGTNNGDSFDQTSDANEDWLP